MIVCETTAAIAYHLRREDEWPINPAGNAHDERKTLCDKRVGWDIPFESARASCSECGRIAALQPAQPTGETKKTIEGQDENKLPRLGAWTLWFAIGCGLAAFCVSLLQER